jgi:hypothetical protein
MGDGRVSRLGQWRAVRPSSDPYELSAPHKSGELAVGVSREAQLPGVSQPVHSPNGSRGMDGTQIATRICGRWDRAGLALWTVPPAPSTAAQHKL